MHQAFRLASTGCRIIRVRLAVEISPEAANRVLLSHMGMEAQIADNVASLS